MPVYRIPASYTVNGWIQVTADDLDGMYGACDDIRCSSKAIEVLDPEIEYGSLKISACDAKQVQEQQDTRA